MDNIIGLNKKQYYNTIAENYLCVPSVMETIFKSEGIYSIDKYLIANFFGIILPSGLEYPQITNFSHSDNSKEQGIILKMNSINDMFNHFSISLKEHYVPIRQIDVDFFSDYVFEVLTSNKHIVCGFEYNALYSKKGDYTGHVSIIVNVDINENKIYLLDPGPKNHGVKKVDMYDLYKAIHLANDGLWIISRE